LLQHEHPLPCDDVNLPPDENPNTENFRSHSPLPHSGHSADEELELTSSSNDAEHFSQTYS
jgi:hypothetical protein